MTKGRRILRAALAHTPMADLARRVGVTKAAVSRWAAGLRVPSGAARVRLARVLPGCGCETWEEVAPDGWQLPTGNASGVTT